MRTRRTLAAILAALMLAPTLAACSNSGDDPAKTENTTAIDTDTTAPDSLEETSTPVTDAPRTLAFDQEDNGNAAFHIMTISETSYEYDGDSTGERVSSAVYDRNLAAEEYLGVKLDVRYESGSWKNRNTYNTIVKQCIEANDGSIDYATGMISCIVPIVSTQYFANLLELPNLDLDNDWWVSSMKTEAAINGKLLTLMGDVCLSMYKGLTVVLFNKELVGADDALEDPYTLVESGAWTYDRFMEQTAGHGKDVNGDGVYEFGVDVIAMMGEENAWRAWNAALDIHVCKMEDGVPTIQPLSDKLATAAAKFQAYWDAGNDIYMASDSMDAERAAAFAADQVIYTVTKLNLVESLGDMESDFGIVPMPKYDEDQAGYYTPIAGASDIIVVPNTVANPGLVGKVLEAMSFYSNNCVTAYYDSAMKERYSRDPETAAMLDLVRAGAYNGVDYLYASTLGGSKVWVNYTVSPDTLILKGEQYNVSSLYESNTPVWNKSITKTVLPAYE